VRAFDRDVYELLYRTNKALVDINAATLDVVEDRGCESLVGNLNALLRAVERWMGHICRRQFLVRAGLGFSHCHWAVL
jgi:hypothetical protein